MPHAIKSERDMKILILDIETRPNLAYVWGLWDQIVGLNQIVDVGSVISFAAKWYEQKNVMFHSDFHDGHEEMVKRAWELIDEADAVVHFNGKAFDMKHLQREFLLNGLPPASPHKDIDLLTTVRSRFKFPSNKLDHVAGQLGVGNKVEHEGFDLWVRCMAGEKKAWDKMKRYNVQDVRLTEKVYVILRPWITSHPNRAVYDGRIYTCPTCGSNNYQKRGKRHTNAHSYQQFQCNDCRSYFSDRRHAGIVKTHFK